MSNSPVSTFTRAATRKLDEPLNILCMPTHERYESLLSRTGHNFYAYHAEGIKTWNETYSPVPDNYHLLDGRLGFNQIPLNIDFDIILSQNKFGQFQTAYPIARSLQIPMISLEHTLPMPEWTPDMMEDLRGMRGDVNVFISEYSTDAWKWGDLSNTMVVHHGVDSSKFSPDDNVERNDEILSVVNDWINRDWCCGFGIWRNVSQGLPVKVVGDTPGLSEPAGLDELSEIYRSSKIFLNTSTISPVPTALLEAMSSGCAVVSTATCMIPEIIQNGINGFISNDEDELKQYLVDLLNDPNLCEKIGSEARKTIVERFSEESFLSKWDDIFLATSRIFA